MKKIDWRLILIISLPIIFIIVLALAYLLPSSLAQPQYDFLYSTTRGNGYSIDTAGNRLKISNYYNDNNSPPTADEVFIKRYHVVDQSITDLTVAEANELQINTDAVSPDGFTVSGSSYDYGIIPMFIGDASDDHNSTYLVKGTTKKKVDLHVSKYNVYFLAWVIK